MSAPAAAEATSTPTTATPQPDQSITFTTLDPALTDDWLDHLTASFSHKPTPRSYFHRHLIHDPHIDHAGIVVARSADQRCVASVRVFVRALWLAGQGVACGGVGEVSTQVEWRGRGLAAACLRRGVEYMQSLGVPLSSLHTSNAVAYYQRLGWQPVERVHGLLSVDRIPAAPVTNSDTSGGGYSIQQLSGNELTASPLLPSIMAVYASYACQFNGPVQRTAEYWQRWVHAEHEALAATPNPVVVLVATSTAAPSTAADVCGYAFLQRFDRPITVQRVTSSTAASDPSSAVTLSSSRLQVREFACSTGEMSRDGGRALFLTLVHHSVHSVEALKPALSSDALHVHYALPIALTFRPTLDSEYEQVDTGFMYRPMESIPAWQPTTAAAEGHKSRYTRADFAHLSQKDGQQLLTALQQGGRHKHVFFATDAF